MKISCRIILVLISVCLFNAQFGFCETVYSESPVDIQAVETDQAPKYLDFGKMYVGEDKYEKFNRKMFRLNSKLNKYIAKPVHILWSSIMPKYGIDRLRDAYNNIEYPKRLASCLLQRDGKALKVETLRFLTNSTLGLGGLFDPADKIFKIKPTNENMEQALCKCKVKTGSYLVMPCLNSCTPRSLCGRALEAALDPVVYLASPVVSLAKFGMMVNRTSYMQPLANMIESNYADPYDIHKKLFGMENYIRNSNFDRDSSLIEAGNITGAAAAVESSNNIADEEVIADIILENYNIQSPVVDSMKTSLFENPEVNKSIWNELSVWNRSFAKRIKTGEVLLTEGGEPYKFRYILQKNKKSPLVILYPSIGEGIKAHHSVIFAKMFYDKGYSVVIQGSHFHWEFVKSLPDGYAPGLPYRDVEYIRLLTSKELEYLGKKYGLEFGEKTIVGTSFGALATLFVADAESRENILGISKFIAISPPIELTYALKELDKNSEEFDKNLPEVKDKIAKTAAKILQIYQIKDEKGVNMEYLPFSEEEGKLITTFILRQKLSDLVLAIENPEQKEQKDFYNMVNNLSYRDYVEKYLLEGGSIDEKKYETSLYSIGEYLKNNDNYIIYHSLDDYFVNKSQIAKLKELAGKHLVCLNCGSHLGFLYRKEFANALLENFPNGLTQKSK